MKRRLVQLLFAFGVLTTLGFGLLLARGFWVRDSLNIERARFTQGRTVHVWDILYLGSDSTGIDVVWYGVVTRDGGGAPVDHMFAEFAPRVRHLTERPPPPRLPIESPRPWERLGFCYFRSSPDDADSFRRGVRLPGWFPLLACAAAWVWPLARARRRRRRAARLARGLCVGCGYDLRGADHERCPECGHLVPSASHGEPSALSKMK